MTQEHILQAICTLNEHLSRKLKVPFGTVKIYTACSVPDDIAGETSSYYILKPNSIVLLKNGHIISEYREYNRSLMQFFLDRSPEDKRRQASILLTVSPLFWRLKSELNIPAGTLPTGHLLQTAATALALVALSAVWYAKQGGSPENKPVGIYMLICFILSLSSIVRLGDWWDDFRAGIRPPTDYARRLGLLLAALVPFYYYANVNHLLLEKPLQYTLLSTTAAAVCMSFFSNRD